VQHEGDPLGWSQPFQHHEQRNADRVPSSGFVLGVCPFLDVQDRLGLPHAQRLFTPRTARAQHVQAHPGDDRPQPSTQVLHFARAGAPQPQPCFLDGVIGLARRAEHPVGHGSQVSPVLLESLRQIFVLVHPSRSSLRFVIVMTNGVRPM